MSLTTDPNDPRLGKFNPERTGQDEAYLVLSADERAKGFVRPVRNAYVHRGIQPKGPTRELTADEHARYDQYGYVAYEPYPEDGSSGCVGRFWTKAQLNSGCGMLTTMGQALAETYARNPKFYGATYCTHCGRHFPVEEFIWNGTSEVVGS
jgi:hypothetical protein